METVQRVLLVMICGRTEQADKQEDPKARACRQRAVVYAVCAAACLGCNIVLGAMGK